MDWELYDRYRATVVLAAVAFISCLLLLFQGSTPVRRLRSILVSVTVPVERFLSQTRAPVDVEGPPTPAGTPSAQGNLPDSEPPWSVVPEERRLNHVLISENKRLHELLDLRQNRWPRALAASVVGRDPQRWFQEIVLDKGKDEGLRIDDPVVAIVGGQEGLVGRITDVSSRVAKVMLIQDSLSSVAVTVQGSNAEDGVIDGSNSHDLLLKYLNRSSRIKIGDNVVTSGLGHVFPPGITVGWIEDLSLDQRQLFLQARLRPAIQANQLHVVLVLVGPEDAR